MTPEVAIRPAQPGDAPVVARLVAAGFATYAAFAPRVWISPETGSEKRASSYRQRMSRSDYWGLVGVDGPDLVGHVAFEPSEIEGLAHFWNLYVAEGYWGTGLATTLHRRAVVAAAELGFSEMRLYVPAGHARARRFYEREGWRLVREGVDAIQIGLDLVELRRAL